jgi:hypothetical protein
MVSGLIYFIDLVIMGILGLLSSMVTGEAGSTNYFQYVRLAFQFTYPIMSNLNLIPFVSAVLFALQIKVARTVVLVWYFILDLIPVAR